MSFLRRRVVYSPGARRDLEDITRYTVRHWGVEQSRRYRREVRAAIQHIAKYPFIGPARPEFGPTSRIHPINEHIVIYDVGIDVIVVQQIIHARSDWLKESSD